MSGGSSFGRLDAPTLFALRRPGAVVAIALAALAAAGIALLRLRPVTDVAQIVRTDSAAALAEASATFGLEDQAILLLEARDADAGAEQLLAAADVLERELMASDRFESVAHGLPLSIDDLFARLVLPYGILYLDPGDADDARALDRLLSDVGRRALLDKALGSLDMPGLGQVEAFVERDPLELHRPVIARLRTLRGSYELRAGSTHFLSEDGRALLLTAVAKEPASRASAARGVVAAVDAAWAATREEVAAARGLTLQATGAHFLAEESERIIGTDLTISLSTSIVVAAMLLAFGLRLRPWAVPAICLPTLWGCAVGVGLFVALRPELAILSLGCSAILVGLGIDFTIHLSAAALERRGAGRPREAAVVEAVAATRGALALATLTSMAAFGAFVTSDQGFLGDMGLLTCAGLVCCLIGALLLLPPVLARVAVGGDAGAATGWRPRDLGAARIARAATRRPLPVLAVAALLTAVAAAALLVRPIGFEDDLRDIHAADSPVLAAQRRVAEVFGGSREPLLVLVAADDEEAVVAACQRLERPLRRLIDDGTLRARSSIAAFLPEVAAQRRTIARLAEADAAASAASLRAALGDAGFDPAAFDAYIAAFERALAQRAPLGVAAARDAGLAGLVDRFVGTGTDGRARALVAVYPTADLWEASERARVVGAVRAALDEAEVDAAVTGLYVVSTDSARRVADDFRRVSLLTLGGVVLVMALRFLRSPGSGLLVLLPASLGAVWTAGALTLGGYELNLMNLGVLPMVLAIGIDDGIHVVHRGLSAAPAAGAGEAADAGGGAFAATIAAVVLTSLTTMVTFGSLGLSRNQGIASVGVLSFVGVGACLIASVAVLPAAMALFGRRRPS